MALKGQGAVCGTRGTKPLTDSECPPGSGGWDFFSSMEGSGEPFSKCLLGTEMQMGAWLRQRLDEGIW